MAVGDLAAEDLAPGGGNWAPRLGFSKCDPAIPIMRTTARFRRLALLLTLGGPLAGLGAFWAGREHARESVLAYLPVTGGDRAVTLGTEVFLGYELVLGLVLVTQAWRREKDLRRRNGLMDAVIQSVTEGVVVADTGGRFVAVNEAARRIVGGAAGREIRFPGPARSPGPAASSGPP